jgi:hypothetical protein
MGDSSSLCLVPVSIYEVVVNYTVARANVLVQGKISSCKMVQGNICRLFDPCSNWNFRPKFVTYKLVQIVAFEGGMGQDHPFLYNLLHDPVRPEQSRRP